MQWSDFLPGYCRQDKDDDDGDGGEGCNDETIMIVMMMMVMVMMVIMMMVMVMMMMVRIIIWFLPRNCGEASEENEKLIQARIPWFQKKNM